ncbi:hypothetical protein AAHA92_02697 [Salvia divinorum]|uniref:Uncharacterized protein n=1 Tax=Salvia divinorum TaxID=28513 RepID=A0ABD1IFB2_SALDI
MWESQVEYHVYHNDWLEVSKLLEVVPPYALSPGSLSISLDDIHPASSIEYGHEPPEFNKYSSFLQDLDTVCMTAKHQTFHVSYKQVIFCVVKEAYGAAACKQIYLFGGLLGPTNDGSSELLVIGDASIHPDAMQSLHKVVIHFCAQYNLLYLLDIYLDTHKLAIDHSSLSFLFDAAGDNEWVKCLLLMRVKGKEYDASFLNARAVAVLNSVPGNKLTVEMDDIIHAVDDIAGAGEMAALATLMLAPAPLQECLSSGSVKDTVALLNAPWRTLDQPFIDPACRNLKAKMSGYSELLDYLNWREGVFFSSLREFFR